MPWPSSSTTIARMPPPPSGAPRCWSAPASIALSSSSRTTDAGRSTTSPAAIWLISSLGSSRIGRRTRGSSTAFIGRIVESAPVPRDVAVPTSAAAELRDCGTVPAVVGQPGRAARVRLPRDERQRRAGGIRSRQRSRAGLRAGGRRPRRQARGQDLAADLQRAGNQAARGRRDDRPERCTTACLAPPLAAARRVHRSGPRRRRRHRSRRRRARAIARWPFFARVVPEGAAGKVVLDAVAAVRLAKPVALHLTLARETRPAPVRPQHPDGAALRSPRARKRRRQRAVREAAVAGLLHDLGMLHIAPACSTRRSG